MTRWTIGLVGLGLCALVEMAPGVTAEEVTPVAVVAPAEVPDLDTFLSSLEEPLALGGVIDCDFCPGGPGGPARQCFRYCRSLGLCVDQCYADAGTCELVSCICLSC